MKRPGSRGPRLARLLAGCLVLAGCAAGPAPGAPQPAASDAAPLRASALLPDPAALQRDVEAVLASLADEREGEVYPGAVEGTDPDALAVAVALVDGRGFQVGDAAARFPLMSASKPFTYALAVEQRGAGYMTERVGMAATGFAYNAVAAGAVRPSTAQNPMVNAGAIATHSHLLGDTPEAKSAAVVDLYSRMAGRRVAVEEAWRAEPRALTYTLAHQMKAAGRLDGEVEDATRRYLEACIVAVGVEDLAWMGATLAAGGVQPATGERVLAPETARATLAAMAVAGMYEDSGAWWAEVGLPAKSAVSGAVLAVAPGWGAIAAYSPRLDAAGNSVRGGRAVRALAQRWRLHGIDRLLDAAPPAEGASGGPGAGEAGEAGGAAGAGAP